MEDNGTPAVARTGGRVWAPPSVREFADAWDKFNRAAADVEIYNTERKPLVFAAFGLLAEAARR